MLSVTLSARRLRAFGAHGRGSEGDGCEAIAAGQLVGALDAGRRRRDSGQAIRIVGAIVGAGPRPHRIRVRRRLDLRVLVAGAGRDRSWPPGAVVSAVVAAGS